MVTDDYDNLKNNKELVKEWKEYIARHILES